MKNCVVGKNIKFNYSFRHKLGIALFLLFLFYAAYIQIDVILSVSFELGEQESNRLLRYTTLKLAGLGWVVSMIVYYGLFDRPMRAKLKSLF